LNYWLMVERLENWEVDRREGFRRFGIPEHKAKLASGVRSGDQLLFYVSSGISKLADIRKVTEDGLRKLPMGGDYDSAFPLFLSTAPQITLARPQWVPLHPLTEALALTRGKSDWRQIMRTSIRRLSDDDGRLLANTITAAARSQTPDKT
jgi:hypothetical protein